VSITPISIAPMGQSGSRSWPSVWQGIHRTGVVLAQTRAAFALIERQTSPLTRASTAGRSRFHAVCSPTHTLVERGNTSSDAAARR
jgi:hypothetical protein